MSQPIHDANIDVIVDTSPIQAVDVAGVTIGPVALDAIERGPQGPTGPTGPPGGQWTEVREYTAAANNVATPTGIAGGWVTVISGGSGGGSGRRGAAGTIRGGGGGGCGSALWEVWLPAADWGTTYTVQVGGGGLGGAAVTVDDTNGSPGAAGGFTMVSTASVQVSSNGTSGGGGGTATGASGGAGNGPNQGTGTTGGAASSTGAGGSGGSALLGSPGAGGGGGGISSANAASTGGGGGPGRTVHGAVIPGGVVDGTLPVAGTNYGPGTTGGGGGGGAASITQAAQAGADGGVYGGGGGGGGASLNGFASGKGGDGKAGYARIRFVYNPSAAPVDNVESYVDLGNKTGAVTVDYRAGRWQKMTLTGNVTLTLTNLPTTPIVATLFLMLTQDATGARTVTWPAGTKWPSNTAPALGPYANTTDLVQLLVINGVVYATVGAWGFQ